MDNRFLILAGNHFSLIKYRFNTLKFAQLKLPLNEFRTFLKDPVFEQYLEQNSHMAGLQMPFPETDSSTVVRRFRQDYVEIMTNQGSIEGGLNSVIGTSYEGEQREEWSCNSYGTAADTDLCEVESTPSDPSHRLSELDGS